MNNKYSYTFNNLIKIKIEILLLLVKNKHKVFTMDLSLLISTIIMLKQSILKDYLFKIMKKLNKLSMQNHFNESIKYNINKDTIEDINIILENMDDWIRNYNSAVRMTMKRELMTNLGEIKRMFQQMININ